MRHTIFDQETDSVMDFWADEPFSPKKFPASVWFDDDRGYYLGFVYRSEESDEIVGEFRTAHAAWINDNFINVYSEW